MVISSSATGAVLINEMMANAPGADGGREYFELRGTPGMSLNNHYLLSLEGQGTGRGDVNQFFDFTGVSLGTNGYLIALQNASAYTPIVAGATVLQNAASTGWGQANTAVGSSVGHSSDGTQTDLENSATTILLVNIGGGAAPTLTTDLDPDNDNVLDLPAGWTLLDSIGLLDGANALAEDVSYGAITFRIGDLGSSASGNVIDVSPTGTTLYVGRRGESIGSTTADWFGAVPSGTFPDYVLGSATDPFYNGKALAEMQFGGLNPVPEPTTFGLLAMCGSAALLRRRRR